MTKRSAPDCVYFFSGGWLNGRWEVARPVRTPYAGRPAPTVDELYASIRLQGYPVVRGFSRIGPPDTPPAEVEAAMDRDDVRRPAACHAHEVGRWNEFDGEGNRRQCYWVPQRKLARPSELQLFR